MFVANPKEDNKIKFCDILNDKLTLDLTKLAGTKAHLPLIKIRSKILPQIIRTEAEKGGYAEQLYRKTGFEIDHTISYFVKKF